MTEDGGKFEVVSRHGEVFTGATEEQARAKRRAAFADEVERMRQEDPESVRLARQRVKASRPRKRDVIDVRGKKAKGKEKPKLGMPTPERMQHADFVEEAVYDVLPGGRRSMIGRAWQVRPRFLSIEGLSAAQLRALTIYRRTFDESQRSEVKSALDVGPGGRSGLTGAEAAFARLETIAFADIALQRIEARVRSELAVLRAVALFDRDFKSLAIDLFGGREVQRIDARKRDAQVETVMQPRSGRDRTEIRRRFMVALDQLVAALAPPSRPHPAGEGPTRALAPALVCEAPLVDARYLDEEGYMLPWEDIRAIILGDLASESEDLQRGTD
ncbi:hypothetical protein HY78_01060 [Rhizorhabdus wittichii DC-6]|nr:hypothetical protein HY78_01060 [Rhizorhabdus wittichii DC-6]